MANIVLDFLHNYQTGERRESEPANAYQYDEGHVLEAVLPEVITSAEIHYWIRGMEEADAYTPTSITPNEDDSCTVLGNIPNSYFETNGELRIYIVVTDGTASITTYEGKLHICQRSMPDDYVDDDPENEATRVLTEAQEAAQTATEQAEAAAASAEQAAESARTLTLDTTLTQSGQAADAKAAGDAINDLKDDFHSYNNELGAGYADQLVSSIENTDQTPYNFRKVPYDATLEKVEGIVGVDVVLNQLAQNGNFADASGWNGRYATVSVADGVATMTPESDGAQRGLFSTSNGTTIANHKYFLHVFAKPAVDCRLDMSINGAGSKYVSMTANVWNDCGVIWTTASDYSSCVFYMLIVESLTTSRSVQYKTASIFDLTAMFGTAIADYVYGLETTTAGSGVAWLKEHFPKIFDAGYIAYNAGTMVCVSGLSAKKTVGFNQWDEVADVGSINNSTGEPTSNPSMIRSKNFIPVLPNTTYYFNTPFTYTYAYEYDSNGNFIANTDPSASTHLLTTGANTHYIKFRSTSGYTTYNNDICINLSDTAKNGTYEPYEVHEYPLDSTIDLHGMLKLDAQNNLYADGDAYLPSGQVNHRYAEITFDGSSDENWVYSATNNRVYIALPGAIVRAGNSIDFVSNKLMGSSVTGDYNGYINENGNLVIYAPSSITSASDWKTWLSSNHVFVTYLLNTPTTETAEPYTATQICDPNGTEEYISDTVAPVGHVTKYPLDITGRLDNILSMPTADGTYVLRATVNNGKVTYSWVSA